MRRFGEQPASCELIHFHLKLFPHSCYWQTVCEYILDLGLSSAFEVISLVSVFYFISLLSRCFLSVAQKSLQDGILLLQAIM